MFRSVLARLLTFVYVMHTGGVLVIPAIPRWATEVSVVVVLNCLASMTAVLRWVITFSAVPSVQTRNRGSMYTIMLLSATVGGLRIVSSRLRPVERVWRASTVVPGWLSALEANNNIVNVLGVAGLIGSGSSLMAKWC